MVKIVVLMDHILIVILKDASIVDVDFVIASALIVANLMALTIIVYQLMLFSMIANYKATFLLVLIVRVTVAGMQPIFHYAVLAEYPRTQHVHSLIM